MFDISEETANTIFGIANIALVLGAALVLIGTIGAIWSGKVLQRFADERISSNEAKTAQAVADAAKANENLAKANESIAITNERAAKLENEAAQAKLETERLKRQFAWRRLNDKQFKTLAAGFSEVAKLNINLVLSAITSDPESMMFASDIQRAMAAGGINVQISSMVIFSGKPVVGITIFGPRDDILRIGHIFTQAEFDVDAFEKPKLDKVEVLIGSKPPPKE